MKIVCENCRRSYTIDDAQLSDQPIGAQCPFCTHVEMVTLPAAAAAGGSTADQLGFRSAGTESPSSSLDLGLGPESERSAAAPPPWTQDPGAPSSSLDLGSSFDLEAAPAPRDAEADLGFGGSSGALDPFGFGGPPPSTDFPPPSTDFPGTGGDFSPPTGAAPVSGGSPEGLGELSSSLDLPSSTRDYSPGGAGFGGDTLQHGSGVEPVTGNSADVDFSVGPSSATPSAEGGATCQECGTPLHDEFDKVIGLCEVHQRDRRGQDAVLSTETSAALSSGAVWHARLPDGAQLGPLSLDDLRERVRSGEVPFDARFSTDGQRFQPIGGFKEIAYLATLGAPVGLGGGSNFAPTRRRFDLWRFVSPLVAFGLLVGLGYLAWAQRADLVRLYRGLVADEGPTRPRRPNPLRRYLASWRLAHPDVSGTVREHLTAAEEHHVEDTERGYERAERAYQRALLLDESDPEAIAGYIENFALWRYRTASPAEIEVINQTLEHVLDPPPTVEREIAAVRRAAGALAWVAGDLNNCRAGADAALRIDPRDTRARLILASCFLEGNVQLAMQEAETVRRSRPSLRRADRILAEAYRRGGYYKRAYAVLDERLRSDPKNGAVHLGYGRIDVDLARHDRADRRFRKASSLPGDTQAAFFALGELSLDRGQVTKAAQAFRRAAAVSTPFGRRGAALYSSWGRGELLARAPKRARQLARQALRLRAKFVPALLVEAEAALETGSATTASALAKRALKERGDEPAVLVLAAHVESEADRTEAALEHLRLSVANDPKNARLHALLAAGYLAAGRAPQAYATLRKTTELDPIRADRIDEPADLPLSRAALVSARREFERSSREPRNASVAYAAIGLIERHSGNRAAARRAITRALALDDANVLALIYDAQMALESGEAARAQRTANKLLDVERGSALGHLLRARAHVVAEEYDEAREDYQAALRTNPGLLAAEFELATIDLEEGSDQAPEARRVLERAFSIEPNLLRLRQTLFAYEEEKE